MKQLLNKLSNNQTLTKEEAKSALYDIATGKYDEVQTASFLTIFLMRKITAEELSGFKDAMLELANKVDFSDYNTIDLCGTGGDGKDTFNISTISAFLVAGAGEKVVKHGNYGVSSICGSSNVLEHLGLKFSNNADVLKNQLEKAGICILHAPLFHPAMKRVAPIRQSMGVKTFFNLLGPLINPASPNNHLLGVYSPEVAELYSQALSNSPVNYQIVHSIDGYDEISLTSDFIQFNKNGQSVDGPDYFGFRKQNPDDIIGGKTVPESAGLFHKILKGEGTLEQNRVVIANAALAINCIHQEKNISECIEEASESLYERKALKSFITLLNI